MFPVLSNPPVYKIIKPLKDENQYNDLLINQISWLNKVENKKMVLKKAQNIYDSYMNGTLSNRIKKRCCSFDKLEKHYKKYINEDNKTI